MRTRTDGVLSLSVRIVQSNVVTPFISAYRSDYNELVGNALMRRRASSGTVQPLSLKTTYVHLTLIVVLLLLIYVHPSGGPDFLPQEKDSLLTMKTRLGTSACDA